MLNLLCVLNTTQNPKATGINFDESWVDKLYRSTKRNINIPFEFYCLSNVDTKYNTIKLKTDSKGFWTKFELFRDDVPKGPTLYFDLDLLICKNITDLISPLIQTNKFLMVKEPYLDIINSSMMYWNGDYSYLYEEYIKNPKKVIDEYSTPGIKYSDQSYIKKRVNYDIFENYWPSDSIQWRHHKVDTPINDPYVLIFTSTQKPSNNLDMDLVAKNWI
jgi:hypothetical protein